MFTTSTLKVGPAGPGGSDVNKIDPGTFVFRSGAVGFNTDYLAGIQPIRADAGGTGGSGGGEAGTGESGTGGESGGGTGTGGTGDNSGGTAGAGGESGGAAGTGGTGSTKVDFTPPALPDGTKVAGKANDAKGDEGKGTKDSKSGAGGTDAAQNVDDLPEWAQKIIKDARTGEGDHRVRANSAQAELTKAQEAHKTLMENLAKALGVKGDKDGEETAPDPVKLTEQLTTTTTDLRHARVELSVYDVAGNPKVDGNARSLLDSRAFADKAHKLDPEATDFRAKLTDLIKKAIDEDPARFRAAGRAPATPGGADFSGGPAATADDPEQMSVDDFRAARRKKTQPTQ